MQPGDRLICAFTMPFTVGYRFGDWPLHVTVIPWFRLDDGSDRIADGLKQAFAGVAPFSATTGREVRLGPHKDRPARVLEPAGALPALEGASRRYLHKKRAWLVDETTKSRRPYLPHVTYQDQARLSENQALNFDRLYIVEQKGDHKEIVAEMPLVEGQGVRKTKQRLDKELVDRKLVATRSQAESYIRLGKVKVDQRIDTKPGRMVAPGARIDLDAEEQYVSRAALKLASVAPRLGLDFRGKVVLDVGSSTGGFTDYALRRGATKVIAVELGREQMHHSLRGDDRIELHEQTDIRDINRPSSTPDIAVIDVSFVSLREILPHVARLCSSHTLIAAMVKPQFEAAHGSYKHKGVIKNDAMRRDILKAFEAWAKDNRFVVLDKSDSSVSGAKGNLERFYLLKIAA